MRIRHAVAQGAQWVLPVSAAITIGVMAGVASASWMHTKAPWAITISIPAHRGLVVPAVDAGATLIAAGVSVMLLLTVVAGHTASSHHRTAAAQEQWRGRSGTVVQGELADRVDLTASTVSTNRARLDAAERDIAELHASVDRLHGGLQVVGEGLITACRNAGQPLPGMPDLEEPPAAPVFTLHQGGRAG